MKDYSPYVNLAKELSWNIIESYFASNPYFITKHHLDSYDEFINIQIPTVIKSLNPIINYVLDDTGKYNKHEIRIFVGGKDGTNIYFDHPTITHQSATRVMFPNDARLNDMTYGANLLCDITIIHSSHGINTEEVTELSRVNIGFIPIMLHSKLCVLKNHPASVLKEMGECVYDQGGYFIVDGKEKVIISQERNITNQIFINASKDPKYTYEAFIRCLAEQSSVFPKKVIFKVYSRMFEKGNRENAIVVNIPDIKFEVPLFTLFRCLGYENDQSILECILGGKLDLSDKETKSFLEFLRPSIVDGNICYTKHQALEYLKNYIYERYNNDRFKTTTNVEHILYNNLFTNIEFMGKRFDSSIDISDQEKKLFISTTRALFLGHVVKELIKVCIGIEKVTDRDNYMYKRLAISGLLLGDIFKDFYNQFRIGLRNKVDNMSNANMWRRKEILSKSITEANRNDVFGSNYITSGFKSSLKGSWGLEKQQLGIVQDLKRLSYMSYMSHVRLVASPLDPSIKIRSPHQLNTSQYGIMCPFESPDGEDIGLVKSFAMTCHVTFRVPSQYIVDALVKFFDITFLEQITHGACLTGQMVKLMTNNTWIGVIDEEVAPQLVRLVKLLRRNALINIFTSISWNIANRTINILTEHGRCTRPLLVIDIDKQIPKLAMQTKLIKALKNKKLNHWHDLVKGSTNDAFDPHNSKFIFPIETFGEIKKDTVYLTKVLDILEKNSAPIEFIDVEETNTCMIAMTQDDLNAHDKNARYTHCEIHPSLMFSAYTSTIPLANHNAAPRNIFASKQGTQSIGVYVTNFNNRIDTMSYVLHYPQKRLAHTRYSNLLKANDMPNGQNLIVAISTHKGYNQEDSIIFNKDSIDRGMFNITAYKMYTASETLNETTGEKVLFANPFEMIKDGKNVEVNKSADYSKLDEFGFPRLNQYIEDGDALIGMVQLTPKTGSKMSLDDIFVDDKSTNINYRSVCEIANKTVSGIVDKVYVTQNALTGLRDIKIRLRKFKTPEIGDKAASSHGQKGVCGMILPAIAMPFTKEGIIPDVIINPHAFPSRMTVGHILEAVISKVGALDGTFIDCTPFDNTNFDYFYNRLEQLGYERYGNEIMYDGSTGRNMETTIFINPTYYYRQKHMVSDKINYRQKGKVTALTMQPTQGRANDGGLKIGEMESNALLSHGIASFMKESFIERSDGRTYYVDDEKGSIIGVNKSMGLFHDKKHISLLRFPHSFKLLLQELNTVGIGVKIKTNNEAVIDGEIGPVHNHDDDFIPEGEYDSE